MLLNLKVVIYRVLFGFNFSMIKDEYFIYFFCRLVFRLYFYKFVKYISCVSEKRCIDEWKGYRFVFF